MIPQQNWLDQFGSVERDIAEGVAVAENQGRLYSVGYSFGQIDDTQRTPGTAYDVWVSIHDLNGNRLDVSRLESEVESDIPSDFAHAVAVNPERGSNGTVYVVGETFGDITNSPDQTINQGSSDAFLLAYTPGFDFLGGPETLQFGGEGRDFANDVAIDADGNIYVVGRTENNLGENEISGDFDAFIAKYNPDLTRDWIELVGTEGNDEANAIAIDRNNNIYITGETQGNLEGENNGGADYWLSQINPEDGSIITSTQNGSPEDDIAFDLDVDDSGNIYLTGETDGVLGSNSIGGQDAWVAKYNIEENTLNLDANFGDNGITQFGSGTEDFSRGITAVVDKQDTEETEDDVTTLFLTGYTEGRLNGQINRGSLDGWVVEIPGDTGTLDQETGTRLIGTPASDFSRDITSDAGGNLYLVGETADFLEAAPIDDGGGDDTGGGDDDDDDDDDGGGDPGGGEGNTPPQFDSGSSFNVEENNSLVGTIEVNDPDGDNEAVTLSISGGDDAEAFELDADTNELSFLANPDFENPDDADENNVYELEITAEDEAGEVNTQEVQVNVVDVEEQDIGTDDPGENQGGLDVWVSRLGNSDPTPIDPTPNVPIQTTTTNIEQVNRGNLFQDSPLSFDVIYEASIPEDNPLRNTVDPSELSGLGLRMHFDSSKIEFKSLDNVLDNNDLLFQGEPQADSQNFDGDDATDQFVNVAWQDINNEWPGNGQNPVRLFTANFGTALTFSNDTSPINFTASSTANRFTFNGDNGTIRPNRYTYDVDDNGETDALTDGVQIIRHLFGLGASEENIASNANRNTVEAIDDYMNISIGFDVDGSGEATPLTDGIILARYMFGFRGEDLLAGDVLLGDASRTTPDAIIGYIENFLPESELPQETETA